MKKKHTILVVDDDEVIRIMMQQLLSCSNFSVEVASDGVQAINMVSEAPPDLIILDVSMPKMDGFEVCRQLRADEGARDIPIIFLSAKSELEDKVRGFEMGADDYVPKPFSYDELLARIKVSLRKGERLERERKKAETLEEASRLDELTGLYNRKYYELMGREELEKCRLGKEALSMMIFDIDRMAKINDDYGFQQGTRTIAHFASIIREYLPEKSLMTRYEGAQFIALVPKCNLREAENLAEEVRKATESRSVDAYPSGYFSITASIGVAEWNFGEKIESLFKRTEGALYRAKKTGKNKIACG